MFLDLSGENDRKITIVFQDGTHRTVRIRMEDGKRILSLLIGPENTSDYLNIGEVSQEGRIWAWEKYTGTEFEKYVDILSDQYEYLMEGYSFLEYTLCRKCGMDLTDPLSIKLGIGPRCRGE